MIAGERRIRRRRTANGFRTAQKAGYVGTTRNVIPTANRRFWRVYAETL
jgi:hypothetical protein